MNIINQIIYQDQFQNNRYYNKIRSFFQTTEIHYWTGNPKYQIKSGTLFFKPITTSPLHQSFQEFCQQIRLHTQINQKCIAIIGIPINKSPLEIISDINNLMEQYGLIIDIEQIKIIKTDEPQYYIMALKFIEEQDSMKFYRLLFGKKYNSIERYRILLRQIEYITMNFDQPNFLKFITTKIQLLTSQTLAPQYIFQRQSLILESQIYNKPLLCVICKKCISEIDQHSNNNTMILLLCSHYFHAECLEKLSPVVCPICSYSINMERYYYCQYCCESQKNCICLQCLKIFCCQRNQKNIKKSHIWQHYIKNNHSKFIQLQQKQIIDLKNIEQQVSTQLVTNYLRYLDQTFVLFEEQLNQTKKNHKSSINILKQIISQLKKQIDQIDNQEDFDEINEQIVKYQKESEMHHKVHKLLGDRITQLNLQENSAMKYGQEILHKKKILFELQSQIKNRPKINIQNKSKININGYKQIKKITKQI